MIPVHFVKKDKVVTSSSFALIVPSRQIVTKQYTDKAVKEKNMRRVVITGLGIVSPLGNTIDGVLHSLQQMQSGIHFHQPYQELGLRSQVRVRAGDVEEPVAVSENADCRDAVAVPVTLMPAGQSVRRVLSRL